MADELSLGSVLNYQGNAKDALSSGNFMSDLTLSPETQAALAQFGQQIIEKKKQDFNTWHDNTVKAIAAAQDTHDTFSGDAEILNTNSKELIKHIISTPDALTANALLKNPQGYQDLQSKIGDYAAKVNESRSFNALLKTWDKQTATNTDMNNDVNAKQIELAKQQPLESRMDYISSLDPVSSGEKEGRAWDALFYKNPSFQTTETIPNPADKGSTITTTVGVYDKNAYIAGFKSARGDYFTKKWQLDPKLQEQYPLVDDYIVAQAEPFFKEKVAVGKPVIQKNTEYIENKKDDRQDQMIEFKEKELTEKSRVAFAKIASQKTIAEMRVANNPELNSVVDRYQNADKTMAEGSTEVYFSGVPALISITTASNLGTDVERYLNSQKVMVGKSGTGAPVFRNANSIARVQIKGTDKVMYAPAYKGDDIESDYEYNTKVILSPKDLMEKMATVKEKPQVQSWYNSRQESTQSPTQSKTPVSAEKQLENPKVNQNLKSSYLNLKKVYPSIDTSGIIGDTAHKGRMSDHNNMDAIDITNFGDNSNGVISQLQKDNSVKYIIYNKQIWNKSSGWKSYNGSNPHTQHIHVSYVDDGRDRQVTPKTTSEKSKPKYKFVNGKLVLQ